MNLIKTGTSDFKLISAKSLKYPDRICFEAFTFFMTFVLALFCVTASSSLNLDRNICSDCLDPHPRFYRFVDCVGWRLLSPRQLEMCSVRACGDRLNFWILDVIELRHCYFRHCGLLSFFELEQRDFLQTLCPQSY